jgi:hypothetical protein
MATTRKKVDVVVSAKGTQAAKRKLGGVERSIGSMAKGALAGVASFYALQKAINVAIDAKNVARDAIEIRSKFDAVFRDITDNANKMADDFGKSFGLAGTSARELLGNTADLLTGFGFAQKEALDFSIRTNQLSVDLASFTNYAGGAEGATSALVRAFTGEREALKSLGIVISEEMVKAELLKTGKEKLTGQSLMQAKAEATLNIAYSQSKNAIGDYARTQDDLANVERRRNEAQKEFMEQIGNRLVPTYEKANLAAIDLLKTFTDFVRIPVSKKIEDERLEFNALIGVLTDVNTLQSTRNRVIKTLQSGYKDYIGNINLESAGIEDIAKMQERANKAFIQKIKIEAGKEKIAKFTQDIFAIEEKIYNQQVQKNLIEDEYTKKLDIHNKRMKEAAGDMAKMNQLALEIEPLQQRKELFEGIGDSIERLRNKYAAIEEEQRVFMGFMKSGGIDLANMPESEIKNKNTIIGQNTTLSEQQKERIAIITLEQDIHNAIMEDMQGQVDNSAELLDLWESIEIPTSDLKDKFKDMESMANKFSGALSGAFMQMADDGQFSFNLIADAFKRMLIQMAAEYAAKAVMFGLFSLIPGVGIGAGFSKFVFGAAGGADFTVNKPTAIIAGEGGRAEHVRITPAPINNNSASTNNYISAIMDAEAFKMLLRSGGNEVLIGEMAGDRL